MKKHILLFIFGFQFLSVYSQSDSIKLEGKWTICVTGNFSEDFKCEKGYVTYEFFKDGRFKDPRPSIYGGEEHPYSLGNWILKGNELTIDYDDDEYSKSPPRIYKIKVLSNRTFYEVGEEWPGNVVYTYFQKVE